MEERNVHKIMLGQYARRLYVVTGKTSLYINLYSEKNRLDIKRIKMELEMIKGLVESIEYELNNI